MTALYALFFLASWTCLPVLAVRLDPKCAGKRLSAGLFAGALSLFFQACLSAALYRGMAFGWGKWLLVVLLGSAAGWLTTRLALSALPPAPSRLPRASRLAIAAVGLLFIVENAIIISAQGWGPGPGERAYFRPPFNNDSQRHVILVESLLRGGESPFLPQTELTYQMFWYHLVAEGAAFFPVTNKFPVVHGAILATGVLFIVALLWGLVRVRPVLFRRGFWAFALLGMGLLHTDLYHLSSKLLSESALGIEGDWSADPGFFRYFSLKLVALTCPQHLTFLLLAILFFASWEHRHRFTRVSVTLLFASIVASPVMAGFLYPWWALVEGLRRRHQARGLLDWIAKVVFLVTIAGGAFWALYRFPPWMLYSRSGNPPLELFARAWQAWASFPLAPVASAGALGLAAMLVALARVRERGALLWLRWETLALFVGTIFFTYVLTGVEIRRHFAMTASFSACFFLVRNFRLSTKRAPVTWAVGAVALALHGYFLYCYLGKKSHINPQVAWRDYFALNSWLKTEGKGHRVMAAEAAKELGLDYPIPMEAATAYSAIYHVSVHVHLTPSQMEILSAMAATGDSAPYAGVLGYDTIVWGPVESLRWGIRVKERFIDEKAKLAQFGKVAIYRWTDNLREVFEAEKKKGGNFSHRIGRLLLSRGWLAEAIQHLHTAIRKEPRSARTCLDLAMAYRDLKYYPHALNWLTRATELDPKMFEAFYEKGLILRGLGDMSGAMTAFRAAISAAPQFSPAYRELAAVLRWGGRQDEADRVLRESKRASGLRETSRVSRLIEGKR